MDNALIIIVSHVIIAEETIISITDDLCVGQTFQVKQNSAHSI
jgi:hypothetical protein